MKSITIHNLDGELYAKLKDQADSLGLSLNKLVKRLLRSQMGLDPTHNKKKRDLSFMVNPMSDKEFAQFQESLKVFDQIDPREWS